MENKTDLKEVKQTTAKALDELNAVTKTSARKFLDVVVERGCEIVANVFDQYVDKTKKKIIEEKKNE
jgi:hypothetical protein